MKKKKNLIGKVLILFTMTAFFFSCSEKIEPNVDVQIVQTNPAQGNKVRKSHPFHIHVDANVDLSKKELMLYFNTQGSGYLLVDGKEYKNGQPVKLTKSATPLIFSTESQDEGSTTFSISVRETKKNTVVAEKFFNLEVFKEMDPVPAGEITVMYEKTNDPKVFIYSIHLKDKSYDGDAAWGGGIEELEYRFWFGNSWTNWSKGLPVGGTKTLDKIVDELPTQFQFRVTDNSGITVPDDIAFSTEPK